MLCRFVVFSALALIGAASILAEPASAGGFRGGGGFRAPAFMHSPRAVFRPRQAFASQPIRPFRPVTAAPGTIPQSPHGFATTSALRPFAGFVRRDHRIYRAGSTFPATFGGGYDPGYIGSPYDPGEAIPVYGPPEATGFEPAEPPAPRRSGAVARSLKDTDDASNACRAEKVTVPSRDGEREITVVRC